jgi:TPR repeat protein
MVLTPAQPAPPPAKRAAAPKPAPAPIPPRRPDTIEAIINPPADAAPAVAVPAPLPTAPDGLLVISAQQPQAVPTEPVRPAPAAKPAPLPASPAEDFLSAPPPPALPGTVPSTAGKADLAYGAYQRGYYITALGHATPRALKGDAVAQTLLGILYERGLGVPRDYAKAADWYGLAAAQGNHDAEEALGMMYLQGRGVTADQKKALALLKKAADAGRPAAMAQLASLYLDEGDQGDAVAMLTRAAKGGDPRAQYKLAELYAAGDGVAKDEQAATRWFGESARLFNIDGQVQYAIRLFNGVGTAKDEKAAAQWFQRAAEAGQVIAQNRLAHILIAGRGMQADPVAAAKWYYLSRAAGHEDRKLEEFVDTLTDQQRAEAKSAAQRLAMTRPVAGRPAN